MTTAPTIKIRQTNDPELLEFLNAHAVEYRLVGDHLFVIRSRGGNVAAGPGDWLTLGADGEIDVERGDYARRARLAITQARSAGRRHTRVPA